MEKAINWLPAGFLESVQKFPDKPALEIDGQVVRYEELYGEAASLALTLRRLTGSSEPLLTGIFAYRSRTAFVGVLAALLSGHGYVPLNPSFPPERTQTMLLQAGCCAVIIDSVAEQHVQEVFQPIQDKKILVFPERGDVSDLAAALPQHLLLALGESPPEHGFEPVVSRENAIAYLLFTSGSTGLPKGVMVSHGNISHFLRVMQERYSLTESDRLSQMFDMVFDLSVFDMFMAWQAGACLCVPSRRQVLLPASYIVDSNITVWFSVPSVAVLMKRLGALEAGAFPNLRWSLFCGEALTSDTAQAWQEAAPNSVLENLYGPTEVTVACTVYRWRKDIADGQCENGIVPIGQPLPGMKALVVDEALKVVQAGETGELLMAGPQVALGYWKDAMKTGQSFVRPPGYSETFYRTGDMVRRPDEARPLTYLGRLDHQIKIHGLRVELGEVEAVLREAAGVERAVAIGWPRGANGAEGIVAFLEAENVDVNAVIERAKAQLPIYMVPRKVHCLNSFPMNDNGKIDRNALVRLLQRELSGQVT